MPDTLTAPDVASLGSAPSIAPVSPAASPTDNAFSDAVHSATKDLPTPDAVEQAGADKPPEERAVALQRLRADANSALQKVADENPEHTDQAFQQRDKINEDFNNRIAAQRDQAVMQVAQTHFQTGDQAQEFSTLYDQDHQTAEQVNPQATKAFDAIQSHPAFQEHRAAPSAFRINTESRDALGSCTTPSRHARGLRCPCEPEQREGFRKLQGEGGNATKADAFKAFTESKIRSRGAGEYHPVQ